MHQVVVDECGCGDRKHRNPQVVDVLLVGSALWPRVARNGPDKARAENIIKDTPAKHPNSCYVQVQQCRNEIQEHRVPVKGAVGVFDDECLDNSVDGGGGNAAI